jgi:hypothetical protein
MPDVKNDDQKPRMAEIDLTEQSPLAGTTSRSGSAPIEPSVCPPRRCSRPSLSSYLA